MTNRKKYIDLYAYIYIIFIKHTSLIIRKITARLARMDHFLWTIFIMWLIYGTTLIIGPLIFESNLRNQKNIRRRWQSNQRGFQAEVRHIFQLIKLLINVTIILYCLSRGIFVTQRSIIVCVIKEVYITWYRYIWCHVGWPVWYWNRYPCRKPSFPDK